MSNNQKAIHLVCIEYEGNFTYTNTDPICLMKVKEILLFAFSLLLLLPITSSANVNTNDDDSEEIIITVDLPGTSINRTVFENPFSAYYYPISSEIVIIFQSAIGNVSIRLTNLSTGSYSSWTIDSSCGSCILPLSIGDGLCQIEFLTAEGVRYRGYFTR